MQTIPTPVADLHQAHAIAAGLLPDSLASINQYYTPMWIDRARIMLGPVILGLTRPVTRAELAEIVADDTARPALLAATPEGRTVEEITADSPPEQWGIVREMLEAASTAPRAIVPVHDARCPVHHTFAGGGRHA